MVRGILVTVDSNSRKVTTSYSWLPVNDALHVVRLVRFQGW